ncbi:CPBP family glutamic-type intramembrane protease [Alicyclobacillus acidiphilus]|uniref:CPBP family glutamic-type intramembrane protease n=1 Tax=Alicyclobacillus acidiphilus TaxID=182455 RepID=UPI00082FB5CC|nr:CPBP family glutamic-type intramembrane protease [Alicyclobacillus acidiphilus]
MRWSRLAESVGRGLRTWQIVYMVVFAVFSTLANLDNGVGAIWLGLLYILLSIGSLIVLLPHFRRTLFRPDDPLRSGRLSGIARVAWSLYLYIAFPLAAIGFLQLFSAVTGMFLQFNESNVSSNPSIADYLVAVVAGLEELWRWSMVGTVIVVLRRLLHSKWHLRSTRTAAFATGFVMSSLAFGAGHIFEFQSHLVRAWLLFSLLGAVLALFTIITGRIVLTMAIHSGYDLWITWISSPHTNGSLAGLMLVVLLAVAMITLIFRKAIFYRI